MKNLNFKEWIELNEPSNNNKTFEVQKLYFNSNLKIQEISQQTGVSVGEIYRMINKNGKPNRRRTNHENVHLFANSNLNSKQIASLTGYSERNIRYILRKNKNANNSI